jgi:cytochrome c biogenesis protein CcdA
MLVIGACFTASFFATYTAIGAGAFALLRAGDSFPILARILRYGMALALFVFSALSGVGVLRVRSGKTGDMILQLPASMKLRIHTAIRDHRRAGGLILSSIVLGALATIFELGCTGQVYLPTIVYLIKAGRSLKDCAYLLLYNLAFILPLILVFVGDYLGLGAKAAAEIFKRRMGRSRRPPPCSFSSSLSSSCCDFHYFFSEMKALTYLGLSDKVM